MSRPIKVGLDYFPVDTSWDMKMRLLKAKYKLEGVGLIIELFQAIYREGYALEWNGDSRILVSNEAGITEERLDEIVGFAANKGIFDQSTLDKGFLTSHGIQARWMKACSDSKRKERFIPHEIDLLHSENEFTTEETKLYSDETQVNSEFSTQKKRDERKGNKIIEAPQSAPTPPPSSSRFTPPTLAEVQAYCIERGNVVDPARFIDFYSSKGWMVGKNKMKDWRAAVRNWEKPRDGNPAQKPIANKPIFDIREA